MPNSSTGQINSPAKQPGGFGAQSGRFDVRGVGHPMAKQPGTCISVVYNPNKGQSFTKQDLGPGSHAVQLDATYDNALKRTTTDPKDFWTKESRPFVPHNPNRGGRKQRAAAVSRARQVLRETWNEQATQMGPGTYMDDINRVEFSNKKVDVSIARPGPRMRRLNENQYITPGPGTYGLGGVPHAEFDRTMDKSQPSFSSPTKKGIMASEGRSFATDVSKDHMESVAPGQYYSEYPVTKAASGARGPYDLMTGERFEHVKNAKKKDTSLGPGQYVLKPMAPILPNKQHLIFAKDAPRFPKVPGDRHTNTTLSQYPRQEAEPNPLSYQQPKAASSTQRKAAFGRSAPRTDQRECYKSNTFAGNMLSTNDHSVGSNQYAHQRAWKDGREGMGNAGARSTGTAKYLQTHRSAMNSTTDRGNQHLKKYHL